MLTRTKRVSSVILFIGFLVLFQNCAPDPDPSPTKPDVEEDIVDKTNNSPMQALHLWGANGSGSWFQFLWPHVEVAQANNFGINLLPYTEASSSGFLVASDLNGNKEWFASSAAPWVDSSGLPVPGMEISAFMTGLDATHTQSSNPANVVSASANMYASIAALQTRNSLAPLPVVGVSPHTYFEGSIGGATALDAPPINTVATAAELITLYLNGAGVDLTPTTSEIELFGLNNWGNINNDDVDFRAVQKQGLDEFGQQMIIAAKALSLGLSETVLLPISNGATSSVFWTDPHSIFSTSLDITRAKNVAGVLKKILEGFYSILNSTTHPSGVGTRADSTLITISSDTPHTPLQASVWPDATPGGQNWMYVVGKGYLKTGWFGRVHVNGANIGNGSNPAPSGFDAATGADIASQGSSVNTNAVASAVVFAASRGAHQYIEQVFGGEPLAGAGNPYSGIVDTGLKEDGKFFGGSHTVDCSDCPSNYTVDGQADPDLTLVRGKTYIFNLSVTGHPFAIHENPSIISTLNRYDKGVTGQGNTTTPLYFHVPLDAPDTLYFQCEVHITMMGVLNIID